MESKNSKDCRIAETRFSTHSNNVFKNTLIIQSTPDQFGLNHILTYLKLICVRCLPTRLRFLTFFPPQDEVQFSVSSTSITFHTEALWRLLIWSYSTTQIWYFTLVSFFFLNILTLEFLEGSSDKNSLCSNPVFSLLHCLHCFQNQFFKNEKHQKENI